jgi:subtilase family serine protease
MKQSISRLSGLRPLSVVLFSAMVLFIVQALPRSRARAQGQLSPLPTIHVHEEVLSGETPLLGALPADKSLDLDITLPLRNTSELDSLLQELYDPQSPLFHQFLSVEDFSEQFGPTEEDYAAVMRFAQDSGLTITATSPNRFVLSVTGPVASIESAFNVKMGSYYDPEADRMFYSADREPSANLGVGLWHVSGLDNFSVPHPASLRKAEEVTAKFGAGPGGSYLGSDMRAAYYGVTGSSALTGTGQSVGLLEFGGYNIADVDTYFQTIAQSLNVPVQGISTDGSKLTCTGRCDDTEQVLDIQQAISMAPGLNSVLVYVAKNSDVILFNRMATDNLAKSLSCSWGWDPPDPSSDDPIFKEFAAQGQTLFVATGDDGAFTKKSQGVYPADDDYVVGVGGTDLNTTGPGGSWVSETGWKDSSGGPSPDKISIPSWQTTAGVITVANEASKTLRNCPDVAAEANLDNYLCSDGSCSSGWGGTSFAAPRWAGYLALVNEQSVTNGKSSVGFINPTIYSIALGPNYHANFHDIIKGNNKKYSAEKGFDLVTGWGSPNGTGLINTLTQ